MKDGTVKTKDYMRETDAIRIHDWQERYDCVSVMVNAARRNRFFVYLWGVSAASSFCYAHGITDICPKEYGLDGRLFLGRNYDKAPWFEIRYGSIDSLETMLDAVRDEFVRSRGDTDRLVIYDNSDDGRAFVAVFTQTADINAINAFDSALKDITDGEHAYAMLQNFMEKEDKNAFMIELVSDSTALVLEKMWKYTGIDPCSEAVDINSVCKKLNRRQMYESPNFNLLRESIQYMFEIKDDDGVIKYIITPTIADMVRVRELEGNLDAIIAVKSILSDLSRDYFAWSEIREGKRICDVISSRENLYEMLVGYGVEDDMAFDITEYVRTGKANINISGSKWQGFRKVLQDSGVPEKLIHDCEMVQYLVSKAQSVTDVVNLLRQEWYRLNNPEAYQQVMDEVFPVYDDEPMGDFVQED